MIVNEDSSIVNKWLESITFDTRTDIYSCNMFITQGMGPSGAQSNIPPWSNIKCKGGSLPLGFTLAFKY